MLPEPERPGIVGFAMSKEVELESASRSGMWSISNFSKTLLRVPSLAINPLWILAAGGTIGAFLL